MQKKVLLILVVILGFSALCFGAVKKVQEIVLKTQKDKLSYSIGLDIAKNIKRQEVDVDPALLTKGIMDGLAGTKQLLTDEEMKQVFAQFQQDMMQKQSERMAKLAEQNKKDGEAFLAANKTKEGVVTLPSGLQYKELQSGNGPAPTINDVVTVNYRGTTIDGKEFDSSYQRGEPATFPLGQVIPGWTEALQLMKVGAKWQLFIPSNLAYGEQGGGQMIGPNAALIFEVELIKIEPKSN